MLKAIDDFLNRITMYRLVLYYLIALVFIAAIFGSFGIISYSPISILFSVCVILGSAWVTNQIFSQVFEAPVNVESVYITALILGLIVSPMVTFSDFIFLIWVGVLSMASKYILAIDKKHMFNPAAIAVVITALFSGQSASWWVGNLPMLPFVFIGGLLIVRKIKREDMLTAFFVSTFVTIIGFSIFKGSDVFSIFEKVVLHTALFFFAFVMLTEPLTSPGAKGLQNLFAVLVGFLYAPEVHFGSIYLTPEMALVIGNLFSYLVSPKEKLILKLKDKIQIAPNTFDFLFPLQKKLAFTPGQYMEWTLAHDKPDDRGNRRYFTLASSPTENSLRLGIKFNDSPSSFKKSMLSVGATPIVAAGRSGDFILPKDPKEKIVFIAGGIGITPFRSMIKYLVDTNKPRNIALFYTNKEASEIVYKDVFDEAETKLHIKVVYTITNTENIPMGWLGKLGRIDEKMIKEEVPDYQERLFYLSGPHALVTGFKETLRNMGVNETRIKSDFFPGFV